MGAPMKEYDADQVVVIFAGVIIKGWADGEFVTVEQETDDFTDVVGTDGQVTRSKTNDRRATVTIKTMQSSNANELLTAISNMDRLAPNGAGVGVFTLKDLQGTTLYHANEAWIAKGPNAPFERGATAREWKIRCAELVRFDGGN